MKCFSASSICGILAFSRLCAVLSEGGEVGGIWLISGCVRENRKEEVKENKDDGG